MMAEKANDEVSAHEAFREFYSRYRGYIERLCSRVCFSFEKHYNGIEDAVFSNTLARVYEGAETFMTIEDITDPASKNIRMKAWLGKIAETELYKLLNEEKNYARTTELKEDMMVFDVLPQEANEETPPSAEMLAFESAWQTLSEREQDILRYSFLYHEEGKYMPHGIILMLCDLYCMLPTNIRQVRCRALRKLKENKDVIECIKKSNHYETHPNEHKFTGRRNL